MLPRDILIHMSQYLTIVEYYCWRQTHKFATCPLVEPKLLYRHAKEKIMHKERRFMSNWCADIDCMNKVCSCIDIITPKTVILSMYCSKHSVEYLNLNRAMDLL